MHILVVGAKDRLEPMLSLLNSDQDDGREGAESITCVEHSRAMEQVRLEGYDAVLCDLGEREEGLATLQALHKVFPDLPVLIIAGRERWGVASRAAELGAHGTLVKERLAADLLHQFVLCLGKYRTTRAELGDERSKQQHEEQMNRFTQRAQSMSRTGVAESLYGGDPLQQTSPETFGQYVQRFMDLLELALERQIFRVDYNISETLKNIAEELGVMRASPRDVVDLYTAAMNVKRGQAKAKKFQAYADEGRLLLLEMMGYMASYYRRYTIGGP